MKNEVGVYGGGDVVVLGTRQEVKSFFETVSAILDKKGITMPLLTDMLYKRYIKQPDNKVFQYDLVQ